jgi:hypothetical protein
MVGGKVNKLTLALPHWQLTIAELIADWENDNPTMNAAIVNRK